jgi:hypothetical protein
MSTFSELMPQMLSEIMSGDSIETELEVMAHGCAGDALMKKCTALTHGFYEAQGRLLPITSTEDELRSVFMAKLSMLTGNPYVPNTTTRGLHGMEMKWNQNFTGTDATKEWIMFPDPKTCRILRAQKIAKGSTLYPTDPTANPGIGDGLPVDNPTRLGYLNPVFKDDTYILYSEPLQIRNPVSLEKTSRLGMMTSARINLRFSGSTTGGSVLSSTFSAGVVTSEKFLVNENLSQLAQVGISDKDQYETQTLQGGGVTLTLQESIPHDLYPFHQPIPGENQVQCDVRKVGNGDSVIFTPLCLATPSLLFPTNNVGTLDPTQFLAARIFPINMFNTKQTAFLSHLMTCPIPVDYLPGQLNTTTGATGPALPKTLSTCSNYSHHSVTFTDIPDIIAVVEAPLPVSTPPTVGAPYTPYADSAPGATILTVPLGPQAILDLISILQVRVTAYFVTISCTIDPVSLAVVYDYEIDVQEETVCVSNILGTQGVNQQNFRVGAGTAGLAYGAPLYMGNMALTGTGVPTALINDYNQQNPIFGLPNPLSGELSGTPTRTVKFFGKRSAYKQYVCAAVHLSVTPLPSLFFGLPNGSTFADGQAVNVPSTPPDWMYIPSITQQVSGSTYTAGAWTAGTTYIAGAEMTSGMRYNSNLLANPINLNLQPIPYTFRWEPKVVSLYVVDHIQRGSEHITTPYIAVNSSQSTVNVEGKAWVILEPSQRIAQISNREIRDVVPSNPNVQYEMFMRNMWESAHTTKFKQIFMEAEYMDFVSGWLQLTLLSLRFPRVAMNLLLHIVKKCNYEIRGIRDAMNAPTRQDIEELEDRIGDMADRTNQAGAFPFSLGDVAGLIKQHLGSFIRSDMFHKAITGAAVNAANAVGSEFGNPSFGTMVAGPISSLTQSATGALSDVFGFADTFDGDDDEDLCGDDDDDEQEEGGAYPFFGSGKNGPEAGIPPFFFTASTIRSKRSAIGNYYKKRVIAASAHPGSVTWTAYLAAAGFDDAGKKAQNQAIEMQVSRICQRILILLPDVAVANDGRAMTNGVWRHDMVPILMIKGWGKTSQRAKLPKISKQQVADLVAAHQVDPTQGLLLEKTYQVGSLNAGRRFYVRPNGAAQPDPEPVWYATPDVINWFLACTTTQLWGANQNPWTQYIAGGWSLVTMQNYHLCMLQKAQRESALAGANLSRELTGSRSLGAVNNLTTLDNAMLTNWYTRYGTNCAIWQSEKHPADPFAVTANQQLFTYEQDALRGMNRYTKRPQIAAFPTTALTVPDWRRRPQPPGVPAYAPPAAPPAGVVVPQYAPAPPDPLRDAAMADIRDRMREKRALEVDDSQAAYPDAKQALEIIQQPTNGAKRFGYVMSYGQWRAMRREAKAEYNHQSGAGFPQSALTPDGSDYILHSTGNAKVAGAAQNTGEAPQRTQRRRKD